MTSYDPNVAPDPEQFRALDDILAALRVPAPEFPAAAIRAAERARGPINERLIELIETTRGEVLAGREPPDNAHIFAMLLLAEFEEKRAFPAIASLFSLSEKHIDSIVGDFLTEDLPRVLASVSSGHIDDLAQIVEDRSRYEYVRSAALSAVAALVQRGVLTRDAAGDYLRLLIYERLEREPSAVWDEVGNIVLDLYLDDLFEEVRDLIRSGLIPSFALHLSDVDRTLREGRDRVQARFESNPHLRPVRDVVAETKWWACFKEDDDVATLEEGEKDQDHLHDCDDPHCGHEGVTVRRESPKVGRNDPCPCGSGKKYKKCCLV
jgi:hypothetical protein